MCIRDSLYTAQLRALNDERVREACIFMSNQSPAIEDEPFNCKKLLERCSTLQTVRGVISRVKRFIELLKCRVRRENLPDVTLPLSTAEVDYADTLLCRTAQQQFLSKELIALCDGSKLPRGSVLRERVFEHSTQVLRRNYART